MNTKQTDNVVVFDFETSGMSPQYGDRPIEVGAVRISEGRIVDQFQSLMNPGFPVSPFIVNFTGIGNDELECAPSCEQVMARFAEFIGDEPLVAHNASFDRRFLDAEFSFLGHERTQPVGCSLLVARRVFPEAPNHRLQTLVNYADLPSDGTFHRALADATMTGHLWVRMAQELEQRFEAPAVDFGLMLELGTIPKRKITSFLKQRFSAQPS